MDRRILLSRPLAALAMLLALGVIGGCSSGSGNSPPSALITVDHSSGPAPLTVRFDGSGSSDSDGTIASYAWDFGDGTGSSSQVVNHGYLNPGVYQVALRVTDNSGASGNASTSIRATLSLGGTITAANGTAVDSDTNDPDAPYAPNNVLGEEQPIPNPVVLGGFVTRFATGGIARGDRFATTADRYDGLRATMTAGQLITLQISDWNDGANDLDLYLYPAGGSDPVDASLGTGDTETLIVPSDGQYDILVSAYTGTSNYLLSIGQPTGSSTDTGYRLSSEFVPGDMLVRFRDQAGTPGPAAGLGARAAALGLVPKAGAEGRAMLMALGDLARRHLAASLIGLDLTDLITVRGTPNDLRKNLKLDTLLFIKALRRRADVAVADPNFVYQPLFVPNDALYAQQWHYPLINLPQAWDLTAGDPGVIVAVIDTGVYLAHSDLQGRLVPGYDFISDASRARDLDGIDPNPDDPGDRCCAGASSWHGTHVSGTIAASSNNAAGVAGVAPNARVMPLRVLGVGGGTSYDIQQALRYAAGLSNDSGTVPNQPAAIVNLSLGCSGCYSVTDQQAYTSVRNAGLIVVAAAGNENSSQLSYPASYAGVVSVSAVDRNRQRAPYSNYGAAVDVAAPGGDQRQSASNGVLSTLVVQAANGTRSSGYELYQGTSMATPHVAGVVALMKSIYPALTPAQLDTALAGLQIVDDLGTVGRDDIYGYGLINALKAVQYALQLANSGATSSLVATPEFVDFGSTGTQAILDLSEQGGSTIGTVLVGSNAAWLSVAPPVGPNGLGAYTLTLDRSGLAEGPYAGTLSFTANTGASINVQVSMRVGAALTSQGDTGHLWVLLLNSASATLAQVDLDPAAGRYAYQIPGLIPGEYYLVAGTDSDHDLSICDPGEACGAYPTLGVSTPVTVSSSRSDLDFTTVFGGALGSAAATAPSGTAPQHFR